MFTLSKNIAQFDRDNPFQSIAEFANSHYHLNSSQKEAFYSNLLDFFTEHAYYDRECPILEEQGKRFTQVHLPTLLEVFNLPIERAQHFVALLEKVVKIKSKCLDPSWHVKQIQVQNDQSHDKTWGWCPQKEKNYPKNVLEFWHRFLPKITSLEELECQGPFSKWFDSTQPFESIARFACRFTILIHEEQKKLFGTITHFFSYAAYKGIDYSLSEEQARNFNLSHLPFLLAWFKNLAPRTNERVLFKKHQLIASIQQVTQKQFFSLEPENQLYPLNFQCGQDDSLEKKSIWLKKEWNGKAIDWNGLPPFTKLNPLTASILHKFQYPHIFELSASVHSIESAVHLLTWAHQNAIEPLANAIGEWLRQVRFNANLELTKNYDYLYIPLLSQPGVSEALQKANIGLIDNIPQNSYDEATLVSLLHYNATQDLLADKENIRWIGFSLSLEKDLLNQTILKALVQFQNETTDTLRKKQVDLYLYGTFQAVLDIKFPLEPTQQERLVHDLLLGNLFDSEKAICLDNVPIDPSGSKQVLAELSQDKLKAMHEWLASHALTGYFTICGAGNRATQLAALIKRAEELCQIRKDLQDKPAFSIHSKEPLLEFKDNFSEWIRQMIQAIEEQHETSLRRIIELFKIFVPVNDAIKAFIEASKSDYTSSISSMVPETRSRFLCRKDALLILSLLERTEVGRFLETNQCSSETLALFFNYFLKESEIIEIFQILIEYYASDDKPIPQSYALQEIICKNKYSFACNSEINTIQDQLLDALRTSAPPILNKPLPNVDENKPILFIDGDYYLFIPEQIRLKMLTAIMFNLVYSEIETQFATFNDHFRNGLKKFVKEKIDLLMEMQGPHLGHPPMTKAQAGQLAKILKTYESIPSFSIHEIKSSYEALANHLEKYSQSWW